MRRIPNAALGACAGALLLFLLLYQLPDTAWGAALQDWGHVPLFGVVSLLLLGLLRRVSSHSRPGRAYLAAFAGTLVLGAVTELVQHFQPERTASFADLARDALGAASFLAAAASFDPRLGAARGWCSPARRWGVRGAVLAALLAVTAPLVGVAWAYFQRERAFPRLLSFESAWEERFLTLQTAELVAVPGHPALDGERVGRLTLSPEAIRATDFTDYSGFFIDEPHPDWRGYRYLRLNVFSESDAPVGLSLRVEDEAHQSDNTPEDRFNHEFEVHPGWNLVRIPLASIENAPRARRMDMGRIRIVHLFVYRPAAFITVDLDDWRLE